MAGRRGPGRWVRNGACPATLSTSVRPLLLPTCMVPLLPPLPPPQAPLDEWEFPRLESLLLSPAAHHATLGLNTAAGAAHAGRCHARNLVQRHLRAGAAGSRGAWCCGLSFLLGCFVRRVCRCGWGCPHPALFVCALPLCDSLGTEKALVFAFPLQARMGLPTIGLAPVESWAPVSFNVFLLNALSLLL